MNILYIIFKYACKEQNGQQNSNQSYFIGVELKENTYVCLNERFAKSCLNGIEFAGFFLLVNILNNWGKLFQIMDNILRYLFFFFLSSFRLNWNFFQKCKKFCLGFFHSLCIYYVCFWLTDQMFTWMFPSLGSSLPSS